MARQNWIYGGKIIGVTGYKNTPENSGTIRGAALLEGGFRYQNISTLIAGTHGVILLSISITFE